MSGARRCASALTLVMTLSAVPAASASYDSALEAFERNEFRTGVSTLRAAAHEGDARAQNYLGTLFEDGRYMVRDFGRAAFWYRKAAERGNARGQLNLGRMYRGGLGLERDERRAAYWYRAAAGQGVAEAQFFLALMYESGRGVERDALQAWMWFSLAAELGDEDARFRRDRIAATFNGEELAKAEGALRGYREATAVRGPEPNAEPGDSVSSPAVGAARKEPVAAHEPPPIRGNPLVFRIQGALLELGYAPGEQDGQIGSRTRDSLRKFEAEHGYRRRGRLDERALRRLREALEAGRPAAEVVRKIQTELRRLGHSAGAIDGRPGPRTAAAVESFQRSRGLPVDGRLSLDLLRILRESRR